MSAPDLARTFTDYAARKLLDHLWQIERCARLLSVEQLWYRPNDRSNSVGNLVLHLTGNVGQWILGGVGGRPISRERQAEFDHCDPWPHDRVLPALREIVEAAADCIRAADAASLNAPLKIQEYHVTGIAAITHVVEHFAFHTGQIVTTAKWLLDVDLSLYDELGRRRDGRTDAVP